MSCLEATGAIQFAAVDVSNSGDTVVLAGVPGCRLRVLSLALFADADVAVTLKSGSDALTGPVKLGTLVASAPWGHLETEAGETLVVNLASSVQVSGWVVCQAVK